MFFFKYPSLMYIYTNTTSSSRLSFLFVFVLLLLLTHGSTASAQDDNSKKSVMNIGAILDGDSRIGKEAKTALKIAVENFNNLDNSSYKLVLQFRNSTRDNPLQSASAADELIKELQTQAIVGMETWQEVELVAEVGNRAQVPVLSLATAAITSPLTSLRWPFLMRMATNEVEQMRCVADIIQFYQWRRVITIYEDDVYGGESGAVSLLYKALQEVGSDIEHQMTFPPFSSLSDPKSAIQKELDKLNRTQSRVFIVVQSSLPLAIHLFTEAKEMGMMGQDSVWITIESITSLLDAVNSSVICSMHGVIGIKTYFSESTPLFQDFNTEFRKKFRSEYLKEDYFEPGIYSLLAYDAISAITLAMGRLSINGSSKMLRENILSSNFSGLSGEIRFEDGELSGVRAYQLVNVVGKRYKELGFWLPKFGFSKNINVKNDTNNWSMKVLDGQVEWPGGQKRNPRGWAMPSDAKPMKILVPGRTAFQKFVKVKNTNGRNSTDAEGFCIKVFKAAVQLVSKDYTLNYEFVELNGIYEGLIDGVNNQSYDAAVGDVTILANRTKKVEFTLPYMESGLSMIVPVKSESQNAWMFVKPFEMEMWIAIIVILVYTMFIVWFLEHPTNPEFQGPWKSQLSTALWFIFSTIFFAHRGRLHSNFTRVVIVVWLFVVLILTQTYSASLTSILTVQRLETKITDIQSIIKNNLTVGCDRDSFIREYLEHVLDINPKQIKTISSEYDYDKEFQSGNISAAFLELPYAKVFLSRYCKKYITIEPIYRLGGFGFAFQKGSPIATDISEAIQRLSESGAINNFEEKLYGGSSECLNPRTIVENKSLSLQSFWGIFLITAGTSTIIFLLFLLTTKGGQTPTRAYEDKISQGDENI